MFGVYSYLVYGGWFWHSKIPVKPDSVWLHTYKITSKEIIRTILAN